MAEIPRKPAIHARPLSPYLQIYRWSPTMASSITHRVTGVGNGGRNDADRVVADRHGERSG